MPVWLPRIVCCCCQAVGCLGVAMLALAAEPIVAAEPDGDANAAEFFEKEIRPLLISHCVECHGAKTQSGGLRLDSREAMLRGEERYLPERDKGPERRFLRDMVDRRINVGEFLLPAMIIILGLSLLPMRWAQTGTFVAAYGLLLRRYRKVGL